MPGHPGESNSLLPMVSFEPGRDTTPQVSPNPLTFGKDQKNVTIAWRLPQGSKLRFAAKDGIVIDGEVTGNFHPNPDARLYGGKVSSGNTSGMVPDPRQTEIVDCKVGKDGLEFTCLNKHTRPGIFKYTIKLTDGKTEFVRDPDILNW
jgi:hypothetical protein